MGQWVLRHNKLSGTLPAGTCCRWLIWGTGWRLSATRGAHRISACAQLQAWPA